MDSLRRKSVRAKYTPDPANQSKVLARIPPIRTKYRPEVRQSEQGSG